MSQTMTAKMKPLYDYLDGLTGQADQQKLGAVLGQLDLSVEDLAEFVHFEEGHYARNLLRAGEHYHALLLCWRSGQRTPIHNHPDAVGGIRVIQGTATETLFEWTPSRLLKATHSRDLEAGGVVTLVDPYVHQISNLQAPGEDLITLHVYSPPLLQMDTFSLTDGQVGEFRPSVYDHEAGSGI